MSRTSIYLLGAPRIERDGMIAQVDTRKAIALLAYLALTKAPVSRDTLALLLWEEGDHVHARSALRRTLSVLNEALGGRGLVIEREVLAFERDPALWLDVDEFEERVNAYHAHGHALYDECPDCLRLLRQAVDLYTGDFLAGFTLKDTVAFDDWQYAETERLRRLLVNALDRLTDLLMRRQDFEQAMIYAKRQLALDPLYEPAHRALMAVYAQSGNRPAALRQYRECVRIFEQELGVAPLGETQALYEAIKEDRYRLSAVPAPVSEPAPTANAMSPAPPLIGRNREIDALAVAYRTVTQRGCFVVIEGEAGIGKTRLAESFLETVKAQRAIPLTARCYEGETMLAYAPFIEILQAILATPGAFERLQTIPTLWLAEISRLLPEVALLQPDLPLPAPLDSPGAQARLFEAVARVLDTALRVDPPGVLFIDDLHWADSASIDLLVYIVRRLRQYPVYVLTTWRSEDVPRGHTLRALAADASRKQHGLMLALSRFDQSAVGEFMRAVGLPADVSLRARLHQETEGLPFFVVEYSNLLLHSADTTWVAPASVQDLLQSRLAHIEEAGTQLLTTAAVIGRSFDFETLREVSGRSDVEVTDTLDYLLETGLIRESENGRYNFYHEQLSRLIYADASLARRRLLHRRIAATLTHSSGHNTLLAAQIGFHLERAGQDFEAAVYYFDAGKHAQSVYANQAALAHYQAALALGYADAAATHEQIGDLHTLLGAFSLALGSYETAAALAKTPQLAQVEHKIGTIYHRLGEWELAESQYQALFENSVITPLQRARVLADWSLLKHQRGRSLDAETLAQASLQYAEQSGESAALAQAHNLLGILARHRHDYAAACEHLEHTLILPNLMLRIAALNNLALVFADDDDLISAIRYAERALQICIELGDRHREAAINNNLADLHHMAGSDQQSMHYLRQAVAIFADIGVQAGKQHPEIWKLTEW
ncbi:MAG: AAA family ATPase [Chloroflexota bacterium]